MRAVSFLISGAVYMYTCFITCLLFAWTNFRVSFAISIAAPTHGNEKALAQVRPGSTVMLVFDTWKHTEVNRVSTDADAGQSVDREESAVAQMPTTSTMHFAFDAADFDLFNLELAPEASFSPVFANSSDSEDGQARLLKGRMTGRDGTSTHHLLEQIVEEKIVITEVSAAEYLALQQYRRGPRTATKWPPQPALLADSAGPCSTEVAMWDLSPPHEYEDFLLARGRPTGSLCLSPRSRSLKVAQWRVKRDAQKQRLPLPSKKRKEGPSQVLSPSPAKRAELPTDDFLLLEMQLPLSSPFSTASEAAHTHTHATSKPGIRPAHEVLHPEWWITTNKVAKV